MKITLIVYGISWLILLCIFLYSKFKQKGTDLFNRNEWYLYLIIIAFAPLCFLLIPYLLIEDCVRDRKARKQNIENEKKKKIAEERKRIALETYKKVIDEFGNLVTEDYLKVASALYQKIEKQSFDSLMSAFNKLSLPANCKLEVELAKEIGIGDKSKLYIDQDGVYDTKIWDYIKVDNSPMGAWQVFLLHSAWHLLPMFWHGGYDIRTYIYSANDCHNMKFMREEHSYPIKKRLMAIDLSPEVVKKDNKYYVSVCYWSDWGGLKRELLEITIIENKVSDIFEVDTEVLMPYDCGIRF
jgi:hypothetical protein